MEIELTPEQKSFVQDAVGRGRYQDQADAVHRAMELFVKRERNLLELIASLDEAENSFVTGEGKIYTEETLHELTEDVAARGMARLAAR